MIKYIANINVNNKIVQEEVDSNTIENAKEYFNNFLKYWSKVWFGWKNAFIVDVNEKS